MNDFSEQVFSQQELLTSLLRQAIDKRPGIAALALLSPGGRIRAAVLPDQAEVESVAAVAGSVALLGRRVALEQLDADMRQVYVESDGGYVVLRTISEKVVLLTVAAADANLALVLHDIDQIERHAAEVMGIPLERPSTWGEAGLAIERLRQLVGQGLEPGMEDERLRDLRIKLDSLDVGLFPQRVAALRADLQDPRHISRVEVELMALELDVMAAVERQAQAPSPSPGERPAAVRVGPEIATPERETPVEKESSIRRALKWLASMIESED